MLKSASRAAALLAASALACAAGTASAEPVKVGEQTGLGLTGPKVPDTLKKAKEDPYRPPADPHCESVPKELAALDEVLGPDADAPEEKEPAIQPGKIIGGVVRGMIPHRGVVRFVTGADKKEDELKDAAMAGYARRGYLKGLSKTLVCNPPGPPAADAALQQTSNVSTTAPAVEPPAPLSVPPADAAAPLEPAPAPAPALQAAEAAPPPPPPAPSVPMVTEAAAEPAPAPLAVPPVEEASGQTTDVAFSASGLDPAR
ncbi:hypothetical protein [Phenylobacterium deserti]|uniref:Uncharacterized protein n=1 Tax=Phenylobacterium deserti TaxID=1914756 RepID=A0A328APQ7_9CAUL|nr:hypothetical protein [Phenylobacterium deserti]RAK56993.1 hypothetical protein DJ018_03230 [Phenylobacterium deserti]